MVRPRKEVLLVLVFGVLFGSAVASASEYRPGEVIVKYKDGIERTRPGMNALYNSIGVESVTHYSDMMGNYEHLVLGENTDVKEAIAKLERSYTVEYAQPNYILHALPIQTSNEIEETAKLRVNGVPCIIPGFFPPGCDDGDGGDSPIPIPGNPSKPGTRPELRDAPADVAPSIKDPDLSKSYGMDKIGATRAWTEFNGDKSFIVADIDTGIDYNHDDLSFNIWRNPKPSEKKDIVGFDFIHNDGLPFDDNEHGTHTAGTIAAVGGNGIGTSGVMQKVSLMSLKFLAGDGSGSTADAIRAIDYAVAHGAKVLSNSWGGKGDSDNQVLRDAIERAKTQDVLFIAAAGNDGTDNDGSDPAYPAAFDNDNIISVAATDERDGMAFFSNYGKKTTHVAAPGVNVYSTIPGNRYKKMSGTSMACPHVAGAAGLLWARHPSWNYKKVKEVLMATVDTLSSLSGKTITGGRINIEKALASK